MKALSTTAILLFGFVVPAGRSDDSVTKATALTTKEASDGWIQVFDGKTTFGLRIEGEGKVKNGVLVLGGKKETKIDMHFGFFEASWEYRWSGMKPPKRTLSGTRSGRPAGQIDGDLSVHQFNGKSAWIRDQFVLATDPKGSAGSKVDSKLDPVTGLNLKGMFTLPEDAAVKMELIVPEGTMLSIRNFKLKPTGLQSIFNGKDLTGWKVIPGHKSKFTVTARGELNVKDGNGDIQTEGQWDDFVLQLDVFSNGKHLNSGVFFRCLPGEFWSGYEAQIRNQWEGSDRTKPVDYGTGGIYNRQPARKVVSSDKEWFTMTVIARGNHLATWVNGYQTADFIDNRPADKSARKGNKPGKGPISLQGHDPTTDLSFRNIRIAELTK